jgi:uncharacterized peroxidase-related enzyme
MAGTDDPTGFLHDPPADDAVQALYDADLEAVGVVMNLSRVWAHGPRLHDDLFALVGACTEAAGLSFRDRAVLVSAAAAAGQDPYCALAWGGRLAGVAGADVAAGVLHEDDAALGERDRVLARWARRVVRDPAATTAEDVQALRDAGLDDAQVLAVTAFVALRRAFSLVNAALGAQPDAALRGLAPAEVVDAVDYGRAVEGTSR